MTTPPNPPMPPTTAQPASSWPSASIDGVATVEVLAAAIGSPALIRRVIEAPVDVAWGWLANIETSIPAFDRTVNRVDITDRSGDLVRMTVKSPFMPVLPFRCHFGQRHVTMTGPARLYTVMFGVSALGPDRTLYVQCEAIPRRPGHLAARLIGRHVQHDANEVKRLIEATYQSATTLGLPNASPQPTNHGDQPKGTT
jgi:hypothetical protein